MADKRIGIFPGVFDPVHAGHIGLSLQAIQQADLDQVIFLPERQPAGKPSAVHFAHRVAMLRRAIRPYPDMAMLEMVSRRFSVLKTLPQLLISFHGQRLVLIVGSDVVPLMSDWPYLNQLMKRCGLVVGLREGDNAAAIHKIIDAWPVQPRDLTLIDSYAPKVSSAHIREALSYDKSGQGLLRSVEKYARQEWLYVSPQTAIS